MVNPHNETCLISPPHYLIVGKPWVISMSYNPGLKPLKFDLKFYLTHLLENLLPFKLFTR